MIQPSPYETAIIVQDGIRRMYIGIHEEAIYYLTVENENVPQLAMPEGVEEGILPPFAPSTGPMRAPLKAKQSSTKIVASGSLVHIALDAQRMLSEDYGVEAQVWSAPSWVELRRDGIACERHNLLHPHALKSPYITEVLTEAAG